MARKIQVQLVGDSSSLERSFRRGSSAASSFDRSIGRAGRGIAAVSLGYRSLGRSIAFASTAFIGGAGITAALGESIRGFAQFNDAMQRSVGLAGVAQKNIAGFSQQVEQLAPQVGKSPQELANAFYFVASSGIAASKAMSVVTASAKASAAGLGETQVVADAVTSAMNAYGPSVLSAQKATNVLVSTVREGKGEADQFAGVIGNVASLAAQLGVSFNQVGAALAAETRLGIDATTASTQLQRVFSTFLKVTPQSAKAFASVGLNVNALRDQLGKGPDSLIDVLLTVKKAFAGNLPALAKAFGDQRAIRGVLALVGKSADSTRQIFERLGNVSGSLKTAFDAVSHDTAQRFRELQASAQVLGISVGAIFAPLAGTVASALSKAAQELSGFFDRIGQQTTITGKLNVVWTGLKDATTGAVSALSAAVQGVDWTKVWSSARGIADGLQKRLDAINWSTVGKAIGDGLSRAVRDAIPAAKEIGQRLTDAVKSINVVQLGKALGPGLAAAVATAFATLTDPAFWIHNWDLALSVGLVAFGDGVGRIAGRLAEPLVRVFGRLGEDAALKLAGGFAKFSDRIGTVVLDALLRLPSLVARALRPLTATVERVFARLGRVARFVVKVLGVDLAIHTIQHAVSQLAHLIGHGLDGAWNVMERGALRAALTIVEPFSHLPRFLGGGPFQDMKAALQSKLDAMDRAATRSANHISHAMAEAAGNAARAAGSIQNSSDRMSAAAVAASRAQQAADRAGVPLPSHPRQTRTAPTPQAPAALSGAISTPSATETVSKGFTLPFRLQLAQAKASATKTISDDLKVAREIRAFILSQIPHLHGQKLIDAYNQLGQINQEIASDIQQAADQGKKAGKSFSVSLRLQLEEARAQALGVSDRSILERMKRAAERALKSGKLSQQGRIDAWNEIASVNQQLASSAKSALGQFKQLNTRKLTSGLNLTPEQRAALRARLSQIGPGGTVPSQGVGAFGFAINPQTDRPIVVKMDGKKVGESVTRRQQKGRRRNSSQVRGPNAGIAFGF